MDNKDIKFAKDFAYLGLVINSNGDCSQEIERRLTLRRMREGHQSKDVSSDSKAKIIHTFVFPIIDTMYRCGSWTVKEVDSKKN